MIGCAVRTVRTKLARNNANKTKVSIHAPNPHMRYTTSVVTRGEGSQAVRWLPERVERRVELTGKAEYAGGRAKRLRPIACCTIKKRPHVRPNGYPWLFNPHTGGYSMHQDRTSITIKIRNITSDESQVENVRIISAQSDDPGTLAYDICFNPTYLSSHVKSSTTQL